MARIRTIKPEIWQDEKFATLDPLAQLVFIALISLADDLGRHVHNIRLLDASIFPLREDLTCREALANLSGIGLVRIGNTSSGQRIIQIVNWDRHQKVDHPNLRSALPEIIETQAVIEPRAGVAINSREPREEFASRPTTYDQNQRPTTGELRPVRVPARADADSVSGSTNKPSEQAVVRNRDGTVPNREPIVSPALYATQELEVRAACEPHVALAITALMSRHSQPYTVIYEIWACATGLNHLRGKNTGARVTTEHVIAAIWEMTVNDARWNVSLFRGYCMRCADRPPVAKSPEERSVQKVLAEAKKFALPESVAGDRAEDGTIVSRPLELMPETPEQVAARRQATRDALAKLRAQHHQNQGDDQAGAA